MGLRFRDPIWGMLTAFGVLAGCAGAQPDAQQRLDRAFARIQLHEAAIEHARLAAARDGEGCEQTCAAAADAAREQAGLCAVAQDVADPDALLRCDRARRTATGVAAQGAQRCRCK
jgi:hypothetical protein